MPQKMRQNRRTGAFKAHMNLRLLNEGIGGMGNVPTDEARIKARRKRKAKKG